MKKCALVYTFRHRMKTAMRQHESKILWGIGIATIVLIVGGMYLLWTRPKFLYMPIYEQYEKDSDVTDEDDVAGAEMVEGHHPGRDNEVL